MADVRPFAGLRYTGSLDLNAVITQPYDKISPPMQEAYYARHDRSFVRLILPKAADPYADSKATLGRWLSDGTLARDPGPAFYVIEQEFETGGRKYLRKGFIGVVRVEEFEKGSVLAHERTLSKPKADRLNLTRATEKDFEQIFLLYPDPKAEVEQALAPAGAPVMQATDEYGVHQKVWAVTEPDRLARVQKLMADKVLLIADGHHRYETALNYRKEQEARGPVPDSAALRFKTAAFINITDPGLVILPTHRLLYDLGSIDWDAALRKIRDWFAVAEVATTAAPAELAAKAAEPWPVFALHAGKGRTWLLSLRDPKAVERFVPDRSPDYRELAVVVLHTLLIDKVFGVPADQVEDHVAYERKPEAALAAVDAGRCQVALLLNATRAEQVSRVAGHGERMPQKSTDFYPKLVSGLVFFDVATGQRV